MLMELEATVGLFPGQGAYLPGLLGGHWRRGDPIVREVFSAFDDAAHERLGRAITPVTFSVNPPARDQLLARDPEILQLAICAVSVSLYRLLEARGAAPDVLLGHSLGEVNALVCAGAFGLHQGAAIVCERVAITAAAASHDAGMVSLACGAAMAEKLLDLCADAGLVLAVDNGPTQVVISGRGIGLVKLLALAAALNIQATRLATAVAFHHPHLQEAREDFRARIARFVQSKLLRPTYSPILGRFYRDTDDLASSLAMHLVNPVRFGATISAFRRSGAQIFVEMGAGAVTTRLVEAMDPHATVLAPLATLDEDRGIERAASFLSYPKVRAQAATPPVLKTANEGRPPIRSEAMRQGPRTEPSAIGLQLGPTVDGSDRSAPIESRSAQQREGDSAFAGRSRLGRPEAEPLSSPQSVSTPGVVKGRSYSAVLADVRSFYAQALEYPEEVLTEDAKLEADLGVDSVKRTELLAQLQEHFGLNLGPDYSASRYPTLGAVARLVHRQCDAASAGAVADTAAHAPLSRQAPKETEAGIARARTYEDVLRSVRSLYAQALEYPEEVLTETAHLEADLGVDSVKRTELLARLQNHFNTRFDADFRAADYPTVGSIARLVHARLGSP